jgi:hypothetical protein
MIIVFVFVSIVSDRTIDLLLGSSGNCENQQPAMSDKHRAINTFVDSDGNNDMLDIFDIGHLS